MNYYTNNIKTATAYQRDATNRSASQKILDKHFKDSMSKVINLQKQFEGEKPKKKVKIQKKQQEREINADQILQKIMKHFDNDNKLGKSLQILNKFVDSQNMNKLKKQSILEILKRLKKLSQRNDLQKSIRGLIIIVFERMKNYVGVDYLEIFELFKMIVIYKNTLFTDDSFEFNKNLTIIQKQIQNFQFNKDQIDKYQDLQQLLKQQQNQQINQIHLLLTDQNYKISYKRKLVFSLILTLFYLPSINWIKPSVQQFLKNFNINHKEMFLNKHQKKQFLSFYQQYANKKIKNTIVQQKYDNADKQILSNAVNSKNDIKDNRVTIFVNDGNQKWAQRQSN